MYVSARSSSRLPAEHSEAGLLFGVPDHVRKPAQLPGLRSVLEVALADPDPNLDSYQSVCQEALALSEHQERLIDALLTLATSERGIEQWEPFDLDHIAETVLATHADEAARRGIHIEPALAPARAAGDPKLAELLIANLVDNAMQHNIPNGRIDITTSVAQGRSIIAVGNTGPSVPSDEIQRCE